jgi:hypothetical protein
MRFLLTLALLVGSSAIAQAQSGDAGAKPRQPQEPPHVSLVKHRSGAPVLLMEYPWKVHARASIELRLVTGDNPQPVEAPPLYFLQTRMKKANDAVQRCYSHASEAGEKAPFKTDDGIDLEIIGRRNVLEKPSLYVVERIKADKKDEGATAGAAAALIMLDSWAMNEKLLYVDLPPDAFAAPGKLHVWFLRADKPLWKEVIDWPGVGPQKPSDGDHP